MLREHEAEPLGRFEKRTHEHDIGDVDVDLARHQAFTQERLYRTTHATTLARPVAARIGSARRSSALASPPMVLSPEEDDEDGPLSVPPPGDPADDAPVVTRDDDEDDAFEPEASSSRSPGNEGAASTDFDDALPSSPPAWDEEPNAPSSEDEASEILALLVPTDDDAPLDRDDEDPDDIDQPHPSRPEDLLDEPFDPGDDE